MLMKNMTNLIKEKIKALLLIAQKYDYVYNLSCDDSYDTSHESWDAAKEFVKKYNLLVFN